jgi:hypothetical protein
VTILVSDDFNRANSGTLGGNWTDSTAFGAARISVASNEASAASGSNAVSTYTGALVGGGTWPADQYAEVVIGSTVSTVSDEGLGPQVRGHGTTADCYLCQSNTHETRVYICQSNGSSFAQLGSDGAAVATGDVIRVQAIGTSISASKNGTTIIGPVTDSNISSGTPGLWASSSGSPLGTANSWAAGHPSIFNAIKVGSGKASSGSTLATSSGTTRATGSTFLVGVVYWPTSTGGADPTGVTDSKSNAYSAAGPASVISGSDMGLQWYVCENGTGGSSHTATVALANSGGQESVILIEITSTGNYATFDVAAHNSASSNPGPFSASSGTLATADELLVSMTSIDTGSFSGAGTFTSTNQSVFDTSAPASTDWCWGLGKLWAVATTALSPNWTVDSGGAAHAANLNVIAFKASSGGGGSPTLTGSAIGSAAGTLGVTNTQTLTGSAIGSAAGTAGVTHTQPLTGAAIGSAPGSIAGVNVTVALVGSAINAVAGTLAANTSVALTGTSMGSAAGQPAPAITAAPTGIAIGSATGALAPSSSVPLTGSAIGSAAGTVSVSSGNDITVALTGSVIGSAAGQPGVSITVPLTGAAMAAAAGTLAPSLSVALTGSSLGSALGTASPSTAVQIIGAGIGTAAGTVTPQGADVIVALRGQAFSAVAGTLTPSGGQPADFGGGGGPHHPEDDDGYDLDKHLTLQGKIFQRLYSDLPTLGKPYKPVESPPPPPALAKRKQTPAAGSGGLSDLDAPAAPVAQVTAITPPAAAAPLKPSDEEQVLLAVAAAIIEEEAQSAEEEALIRLLLEEDRPSP